MWFRKRNRPARTGAHLVEKSAANALASFNRKRLAAICGAAFGVALLVWSVLALLDRPIRHVEAIGHFLRVSPPQIETAVLAYCKSRENFDAGFISLDLEELKSSIEAIAWVDRVRIERRWPESLRVIVTEQVPGARWGERGLLNARGELFLKDARYVPAELPQLNGPEGTESQVARLYLDTYPRLATVGLRLSRVLLDARGAWELTVTSTQPNASADGVVVRLGRQDVATRLERFLSAASPLIATRPGEVRYVDMRYSNGFAVGWFEGASLAQKKSSETNEERSPDA